MPARSRDFSAKTTLLAVTFALVACGGSKFSSSAGASAGQAGANADGGAPSGGTSAGGDNGGSTSGGSAQGGGGATGKGGSSGGSSAGAGGKASTTCDCSAGNYCQDGVNKCRACSDFSRLEFAAPVKLATVSQTQAGNERFPRPGATSSDLFYRSGALGSEQIWYDANPVSGSGKSISGATLPNAMMQPADSGPLLAPGALQQNFFFDRFDLTTNSRKLMLATWPADDLEAAAAAPTPFNGAGDNYSIAVAPDVERAYWMTTRNGKGPQLVWSSIVSGEPTDPAVLDLQVQVGQKTCALMGEDATPWVNLVGTILLFRSISVDESCTANDSNGTDLFAVPLAKDTGLPATAAGVPLSALNVIGGGSNETDPSFSADACFIYYASDGGKSDFDIYRAARN